MPTVIPDTLEALRVPLASLKPYKRNPRQGDVGAIVTSLQRHGQYRPIVVNARTQEVLAGNHTLTAARELGWEEIAATFVDVDEDTAARIVLIDNRSNDLAAYDDQALVDLLRTLPDLDGTGYTGDDLDELLTVLDPAERPGGDTEPIEPPAEPRTAPGDLYTLGEHRLLCGDSTDALAVERLMDGGDAQLLFTSPPYADARTYGGGDLDPAHLAEFIAMFAPVTALMAVNLGLIRRDGELMTYWDDYITAARDSGLRLLSWNVWDRGIAKSVAQKTAMFPIEHEWILVFGHAPTKLTPTVPNPGAGQVRKPTNRQRDGTVKQGAPKIVRDCREIGTVYRGATVHASTEHPAMFPVEFAESYIAAATKKDGIVAEPFAGSGSTLIACENLGRRCYAIELDPAYCDVIVDRWERHTGQTATHHANT